VHSCVFYFCIKQAKNSNGFFIMFFSNVAALLPIPQAKYIEFDSGTIRCVANYVTVYGACMVTLSI